MILAVRTAPFIKMATLLDEKKEEKRKSEKKEEKEAEKKMDKMMTIRKKKEEEEGEQEEGGNQNSKCICTDEPKYTAKKKTAEQHNTKPYFTNTFATGANS